MFASIMRGTYISLRETAEMWSLCYVLNKWRNDMRPKRYPYSKPQWEIVVHIMNRLLDRITGEVK